MKIKKIFSAMLVSSLILPMSTLALTKTESVFTTLNTDGTLDKLTVTNHIKVKTKEELLDQSDLDNIKNVNGNETFSKDDNNIIWKSDGKDIYYQGTTNKEMPLDINIKYFLNDKELEAKNMIGKKGNVKIEINFTNKEKNIVNINGKNETVYTPFVVMAGTIIDSKNNSDIKVQNGKVVETGTKNIVAALSTPGLFESLNINNDMNKIVINYTTSSFSLNNIYIVATPKIIEEKDLKGFDEIDSMLSNINKLQTSMNEIENGSIKLQSGVNELDSGVGSLKNGTELLLNGVNKISESLPNEKTNTTNEATLNSLKNTNNLTVEKLTSANESLTIQKQEVEEKIKEAQAKKEYVASQLESLNINLEKSITAYNDYSSKLEQVNIGIENINSQLSLCDEETKNVLENKLIELNSQKQSLETVVPLLKNQMDAVTATKEALNATLTSIDGTLVLLNQTLSSLNTSIEANTNLISLISGNNKVVDSSLNTINSMRKLSSAMSELSNASSKINEGVSSLKTGTEKLNSGSLELQNGISKFNKEGINKLSNYGRSIKYYKSKVEALIDLSKIYKGFSSNNSSETIFINKVKSAK